MCPTYLRDLFTDKPDSSPCRMAPIQYATQVSPVWLAASREIDFSQPDNDELKLREAILKSEGLPRVLNRHQPWIGEENLKRLK